MYTKEYATFRLDELIGGKKATKNCAARGKISLRIDSI